MMRWIKRIIAVAVVLGLAALLGWAVVHRPPGSPGSSPANASGKKQPAAPVEVAPITHGSIEQVRTFSGTLEAPAAVTVAPKVGGRIERLTVDLADAVTRGQVVAELDNDEYQQQVLQADAELKVAQANLAEARSGMAIAQRELQRATTLQERGVASDAQLDTAKSLELAKEAAVAVAEAEQTRAEAALRAAKIRLGYATVVATWAGGDDQRIVAERFVDEGDTVTANTPLFSIVELQPIQAVIYVTERDYGLLQSGQHVKLQTDAYPGETFAGRIDRIAPVFRQASRQARIELSVDNPDLKLKPGMFIRATTVLQTIDNATMVPEAALVRRNDRDVVFLVDSSGKTVSMREVTPGIRDAGRVQIAGGALEGRVVTLGQQQLDDGAAITIPEPLQPQEAPPR